MDGKKDLSQKGVPVVALFSSCILYGKVLFTQRASSNGEVRNNVYLTLKLTAAFTPTL